MLLLAILNNNSIALIRRLLHPGLLLQCIYSYYVVPNLGVIVVFERYAAAFLYAVRSCSHLQSNPVSSHLSAELFGHVQEFLARIPT